MPAPPRRWFDGRGRRFGRTHRRWGYCGRAGRMGREHCRQKQHQQPASDECHHQSRAIPRALLRRRARAGSRVRTSRRALARVCPAVEAGSGDGSRRVRSALCIGADPKTTNADGSPHARLGQVEPERSKFDALTKWPCHVPAILPFASAPVAIRRLWGKRRAGVPRQNPLFELTSFPAIV